MEIKVIITKKTLRRRWLQSCGQVGSLILHLRMRLTPSLAGLTTGYSLYRAAEDTFSAGRVHREGSRGVWAIGV